MLSCFAQLPPGVKSYLRPQEHCSESGKIVWWLVM